MVFRNCTEVMYWDWNRHCLVSMMVCQGSWQALNRSSGIAFEDNGEYTNELILILLNLSIDGIRLVLGNRADLTDRSF